jgi:hypothetical protein
MTTAINRNSLLDRPSRHRDMRATDYSARFSASLPSIVATLLLATVASERPFVLHHPSLRETIMQRTQPLTHPSTPRNAKIVTGASPISDPLESRRSSRIAPAAETPLRQTRAERRRASRKSILDEMLDNTAGLVISGEPGSGKSVTVRNFVAEAARSGEMAVYHFDPAGEGVQAGISDVLAMPRSVQNRLRVVAPGQPNVPILPHNPLGLPRPDGMSDYEFAQRRSCLCDHFAQMLLSIFGDGGSYEGRPNQYLFTSFILHSLSMMSLAPADAMHFFPGSPIQNDFLQLLPDSVAHAKFAELQAMKPADRLQLLGSTEVRFTSLFHNAPVMEAHLGVADLDRCANIRQLNEERALVYVDLSGEGTLSDRQKALLANLWLSQLVFTIFNTPPRERVPVLIVCDELPVFARASGPLLSYAIPQTRKMLVRFVGLHQGVHPFDGGSDDQLLRTLTSCCNKLVMRHTDDVDATFWGNILSLPQLDPTREKFRYYEQEAYHDGWHSVYTVDYSAADVWNESRSFSQGGGAHRDNNWTLTDAAAVGHQQGIRTSKTSTTTATHTDNAAQTDTDGSGQIRDADLLRESFSNARARMNGSSDGTAKSEADQVGHDASNSIQQTSSAGQGGALGTNQTWQSQRLMTRGGSRAYSVHEQLQPIVRWRKVLRFLEFLTLQDQKDLGARDVTLLANGQALIYASGHLPYKVQFPLPREPYRNAPVSYAKHLRRLLDSVFSLPIYTSGPQILAYRRDLTRIAVEELERLKREQQLLLAAPPAFACSPEPELIDAQGLPLAYLPPECPYDF